MSFLEVWRSELERRQNFLRLPTLRVIHKNKTPLRADKMGSVLTGLWFSSTVPSETQLREFSQFAVDCDCKDWYLRLAIDRGLDPNTRTAWYSETMPTEWIVSENGLTFLLKRDEGLSPGLFLDQRERRKWVFENSNGLNVLNLFSYTGAFSVAAAKGGAKSVTTVDLSKKYIEWSKKNFELNGLKTESHEFWSADVFPFLEGARRRNRKFDLIICDPPSFSRSKNSIFKFEKDYVQLLELCFAVANTKAEVILSCNFEGWSQMEFKKRISQVAHGHEVEFLPPSPDFEQADEDAVLKTAHISL